MLVRAGNESNRMVGHRYQNTRSHHQKEEVRTFERKKIRRIQLYRVRIGLESPIEYWDLNYWYKVVYYRDYDRYNYVGDA